MRIVFKLILEILSRFTSMPDLDNSMLTISLFPFSIASYKGVV